MRKILPLLLVGLAGCGGGQDFGSLSRNVGGDIGSGYNNSISSRYGSEGDRRGGATALTRGTYPMIQTSFALSNLASDPFDYERTNVLVTLRKPDGGTLDVPAFFDGGKTWRMRYTPNTPGQYSVAGVKLNGQSAREEKLEPKEWSVTGDPQPGFVRLDRGDNTRFVFDNGTTYFPIGHNQAWRGEKMPDIPDLFAKMQSAGENWSRVWMNHWDGKNLDWSSTDKSVKPGAIDLEAAKRWDTLIEAAGKNNLYIQVVLQHHGQYSSQKGYRFSGNVNANWESNPWNAKNGGFLEAPEAFFTDTQARKFTKRKLYYILARWGYSPNILAWELFNEVENTDAAKGKLWDDIAMWHREMALFLRQYDGYKRLLTTSAADGVPLESPVWETVDYVQTHTYPTDVITALSGSEATSTKRKRAVFVGEFGAQNLKDTQGLALHNGLWASLFAGQSGAAQYWDWENVERNGLYNHFEGATKFLTASGMLSQKGLVTTVPTVETTGKASLRFAPGGGFTAAKESEFILGADTVPAGLRAYPRFFQGTSKRAMMPKPLTLQVVYPQPGTFTVRIAQVAKAGAKLTLKAGGQTVEAAFPAANEDYTPKAENATLKIEVPAGAQTVSVENTGTDWLVVQEFALSDYAPALAAKARVGKEFAAVWLYNRANVDSTAESDLPSVTGKLKLVGLKEGRYNAVWWDTRAGKSLETTELTVAKTKETSVTLTTPAISRDLALYVTKANGSAKVADTKPEKRAKAEKPVNRDSVRPGETP